MAEVAFLLNELSERDAGLARRLEEHVRQAVAALEPGERLHGFVFFDPQPAPGAENAGLVRMRLGQMGWYRDFPPVAVDDSPLAMGLAVGRLLRRQRRPRRRA